MKTFVVGMILGYIWYKSRDVWREMRVVYKTSYARTAKAVNARLAHSARVSMVTALKEGGSTNLEIAQLLGIPENSVRQILSKEES